MRLLSKNHGYIKHDKEREHDVVCKSFILQEAQAQAAARGREVCREMLPSSFQLFCSSYVYKSKNIK